MTNNNHSLESLLPNQEPKAEMLPEYDFSNGVRGKYWADYHKTISQSSPKLEDESPDGI
jgi:hypothetical protein